MTTLPFRPRRHWLLSFWLVVSVLAGVTMGTLGWLLLSPRWTVGAIMLAAGSMTFGMLRPEIMAGGYGVWNEASHFVARGVRLALVTICYFVVLVPLHLSGTTLELGRPNRGQSLWVTRRQPTRTAYFKVFEAANGGSPRRAWIASYVSWACETGNVWAVFLLPFLVLLSILDVPDAPRSVPADIYTVS